MRPTLIHPRSVLSLSYPLIGSFAASCCRTSRLANPPRSIWQTTSKAEAEERARSPYQQSSSPDIISSIISAAGK
jgi:hypothetical protein